MRNGSEAERRQVELVVTVVVGLEGVDGELVGARLHDEEVRGVLVAPGIDVDGDETVSDGSVGDVVVDAVDEGVEVDVLVDDVASLKNALAGNRDEPLGRLGSMVVTEESEDVSRDVRSRCLDVAGDGVIERGAEVVLGRGVVWDDKANGVGE